MRSCYLLVPTQDGAAFTVLMMVVILGWVTWASSSLGELLKRVGDRLVSLNAALREHQAQLETRIDDRTRELQETQAQLMHQDKMAGFGLLAAGIAHEVGNPLTSITTIVQVLERRNPDDYTRDKLALVGGQLARIQGIVRELTTFSRPASQERSRFALHEIVDEALNIAKYYKGTKTRTITADVPRDLPVLFGVRDQLVQVVFNLVLNAIDATQKGGRIEVTATRVRGRRWRSRSATTAPASTRPTRTADVPAVLHDQEARHRPGAVRHPQDRRRIWRVRWTSSRLPVRGRRSGCGCRCRSQAGNDKGHLPRSAAGSPIVASYGR